MGSRLALSVTTATGIIGVAVGEVGGPAKAHHVLPTERRHAESLNPLIATVLDQAGLKLANLDLLVVDIGPGRFTGLRVGLATVKALAFGLGLPVVTLTSLETLALAETVATVTAVVDARRNEVFQQVFNSSKPVSDPTVGPAREFAANARGLVVGDGVDAYPEPYGERDELQVCTGRLLDPGTMIELAAEREPIPGVEVRPLYLRDADVNLNSKGSF